MDGAFDMFHYGHMNAFRQVSNCPSTEAAVVCQVVALTPTVTGPSGWRRQPLSHRGGKLRWFAPRSTPPPHALGAPWTYRYSLPPHCSLD